MNTPANSYKRPLNRKNINSCEAAEYPVCMCRCGGALHGHSHELFSQLEAGAIADKGYVTEEELKAIAKYVIENSAKAGEGHGEDEE